MKIITNLELSRIDNLAYNELTIKDLCLVQNKKVNRINYLSFINKDNEKTAQIITKEVDNDTMNNIIILEGNDTELNISAYTRLVYNTAYLIDKVVYNKINELPATIFWSKTMPKGVTSKLDFYNTFVDEHLVEQISKQYINNPAQMSYAKPKLLVSSAALCVIRFNKYFKPSVTVKITGAYIAGTLEVNNFKIPVYVIPGFNSFEYALVFNNNNVMVYPYSLSYVLNINEETGEISCDYHLEELQNNLIVKGKITGE